MNRRGFTIVELLIVIVVIGILAGITIIAYNGVQNRAKVASVQADLTNSIKSLENYRLTTSTTDQYPINLTTANLKPSGSTNFTYIVSNTASPAGFCLIAENDSLRYYVTNATTNPMPGSSCGSFNYASNGSAESGTTCWTNLGGTIDTVTTPVYDGSNAIRGTAVTTGSNDRYLHCSVPAAGAATWNVSAKVYLTASTPPDYNRGLWVNDSANTTAATIPYNLNLVNSWQSVSTSLATPPSTTGLIIRFYLSPGANIYIDNVIVTKA